MPRDAAVAGLAIALSGCGAADGSTTSADGSATNDAGDIGRVTTLYVHGRDPDGQPSGWSYWNGKSRPGINPVAVNWRGNERISDTNATIRVALDSYCSGNDWCYVACHSTGCAQVGYALDLYGTIGDSARWNIYWVAAAGSAEGGSEVASLKLFSLQVPLDEDLTPSAMRQLYDHDNSAGVTYWMFAGAGYSDSHPELSAETSLILPGSDDLVVAYHSACGVDNTAYEQTDAWCNTEDTLCTGNRIDTSANEQLWALHHIEFIDSQGEYSHFLADSNEGISSRMFDFVSLNAL